MKTKIRNNLKTVSKKGFNEHSYIDASKKGNSSIIHQTFQSKFLSSLKYSTTMDGIVENEEDKNGKLLEKIMNKFKEEKKDIQTKDYCIENSSKDLNFLSEMNNTLTLLNNFNFTSPTEEGNSKQLIEKEIYEKYVSENQENVDKINQYKKDIQNLNDKLRRVKGEYNFVKQASEYQKAVSKNNDSEIKKSITLVEENLEKNKELKRQLTNIQIGKNSLYSAVCYYLGKYDKNMVDQYEKIYNKYNNQTFLMKKKPVDQKKMDELFKKITALNKLVDSKEKEINNLKKYLLPTQAKKKGKKSNY